MFDRIARWQPDRGADVAARTVGALALIALAVIHVVDLPGTLGPTPLVGIGYLGIIAAAVLMGGVLLAQSNWLAWAAAAGVGLAPSRGYSEHTRWLVDQEVAAAILATAEARARDLLTPPPPSPRPAHCRPAGAGNRQRRPGPRPRPAVQPRPRAGRPARVPAARPAGVPAGRPAGVPQPAVTTGWRAPTAGITRLPREPQVSTNRVSR